MTAETFLQEIQKLILSQPKLTTHSLNSENSEYGDQLYYCRNMYNCFDTLNSNDCAFVFDSRFMVNCIDCDYGAESELCYDSVDAFKCFNSAYLQDCVSTQDSYYSYACVNCSNVFGCSNLRGKQYCIFNRQLTKEQYDQLLPKYLAVPSHKVLQALEELKKNYPLTQTHSLNTENSPYGDFVYNCKNCYMCFDTNNSENSGYIYDSGGHKKVYDSTFSGESEISYEIIDSTHLFNCSYAIWSGHSQDSTYIVTCGNVRNCLGCVNLYQKEYCILNRQFTKEEYEKISKPILEELKAKNLGWGNLVF